MIDPHVSMSEVARRLGVTLPAVSNWRRRHPRFPAPVEIGGQEVFRVDEMAAWLDDRKIARKDLGPDELPGTTYGTRFRKAMKIEPAGDGDAIEALWRELIQLRGAEDVAVFADLVLGLLYLAVSDDDRWHDIVASGGSRLTELMGHAHDETLLSLRFDSPARVRDAASDSRVADVVHLVERVRLSGRGVAVFDVLIDRFAAEEGRRDAAVHTPASVVRLLVELAPPAPGDSVFDPCCGTGGFLLGAAKHLLEHGDQLSGTSFTGYALSVGPSSLANMNLRLHHVPALVAAMPYELIIDGRASLGHGFDVVLSNPPFDLRTDREFHGRYGTLPKNRTSFAWLEHVSASLTDRGRAAVVMPGGTLFREGAEKRARAGMVEDGVVDAIIALPPQLFDSTAVPVTVWLLSPPSAPKPAGEILFVDARQLGFMVSRTQRSLSDEDQRRIVDTVVKWRGGAGYGDVPGFSASVAVERIRKQDYALVPGRYVGAAAEPASSSGAVGDLREQLDLLEHRASAVNAVVLQRLDGIRTWIR